MKRIALVLLASIAPLGLTACSSEPEEPVEQIIVRAPSEADTAAADAADSKEAPDLVSAGQAAFAACAACHSADEGGASGVGPNLHGVVGRVAGSLDGFAYSDAMAGFSLTWDDAELDAFLTNPSLTVPGTTMVAGAVSDSERRTAIIAYLASLSE